jgi:RimJ/RimL family protein N-acetyltransferase
MIKLRNLQISDSVYILDMMQDSEISNNYIFNRLPNSLCNIENFIRESWDSKTNRHFAIEDDNGEYCGTISLKNINHIDQNAEYAVIIRKKYWGTEISKESTLLIIKYAFNSLNLKKIYLNVISTNKRAIGFYTKMGFKYEASFKKHIFLNGEFNDLVWYSVFIEEFLY